MDNIILRCDNNINGIFTAIYDALYTKSNAKRKSRSIPGQYFY